MFKLEDGLILYHGSYCEVENPNLSKCAKYKDFGQGFYLTTSKEQAVSFVRTSISKAIANEDIEEGQNYGYISIFELKQSKNLNVHIFEKANVDWLHCVTTHRKNKEMIDMENYDLVIGKIADDATNTTLTAYLGGAFGMVGSKEADEFCIQQLLPNKLQNQYCFKTDKAIGCLKFVGSEKIWTK